MSLDTEQVPAELQRVLQSRLFRSKRRKADYLKYLVEKTLRGEGDALNEGTIAQEFFKRENFNRDSDSIVRNTTFELRSLLREYYENQGSKNAVRINLDTYMPTFELHEEIPRPSHPPLPQAQETVTQGPAAEIYRTRFGKQLLLAAIVFVVGVFIVLVQGFWDEGHCGEGVSILIPTDNFPSGAPAQVGPKELVRGVRKNKELFCRCKDYLAVEPIGVSQIYIQSRLQEGPDWSGTAQFGDPDTRRGTKFGLFVVSTTQNLPIGSVPISDPRLVGAKRSRSVETILKRQED